MSLKWHVVILTALVMFLNSRDEKDFTGMKAVSIMKGMFEIRNHPIHYFLKSIHDAMEDQDENGDDNISSERRRVERATAVSGVQQDPRVKRAIRTLEISSPLGMDSSGMIICQ